MWALRYVGQSYAEANCAQFAVQIQREVFDRQVVLPADLPAGLRGQSRLINEKIEDFAERVESPIEGDAVLMVCRGTLSHVGVFCLINYQAHVVHAMRGAGQVTLHRVAELPRHGLKVEGYYRWR